MTAQPSRVPRVNNPNTEGRARTDKPRVAQELTSGMRVSHAENGKGTILHIVYGNDGADILWDDPKSAYSALGYVRLDTLEILNEPRRTMVRLGGKMPQALTPKPPRPNNPAKGKSGRPKQQGNKAKAEKPKAETNGETPNPAKKKRRRRRKPKNAQGTQPGISAEKTAVENAIPKASEES